MDVPFHVPDIRDVDLHRVEQTLRSGWLTTGPAVREFEELFAERVGASHAVAVNSCTAALHLALAAHDIGPGDEVLVPTLTFAATAEVVLALGAKPVLVDIHPEDLTIDVASAERAVTDATVAIMPVHYAGHPVDVDAVLELAAERDILVIEDAAHAFPASYDGRTIGSIGDVTCFSFYANKTLTTGEGGMATTDDGQVAERIRRLSLHGMSRNAWGRFRKGGSWNYDVVEAGYKYNMPDMAAALGLPQLERAKEARERRQQVAHRYIEGFQHVEGIDMLRVDEERHTHAWHLFVVLVDSERFGASRDDIVEALGEQGIGTSVHYRPLHQHTLYRDRTGGSDCPQADEVFPRLLSLPLFPTMTEGQIQMVVDAVLSTPR